MSPHEQMLQVLLKSQAIFAGRSGVMAATRCRDTASLLSRCSVRSIKFHPRRAASSCAFTASHTQKAKEKSATDRKDFLLL
jgi:hypothetical protein